MIASFAYDLLDQKAGDGEMSEAPTIQEEMVNVLLYQLDLNKSTCPGGIYSTRIRKLVEEPKHIQSPTSSPG